MTAPQGTVEKAIRELKAVASADDAYTFSSTTLRDVQQEARDIEKEQAAKMDLRFMRRIEPYIESLEGYAGVLEVFCQGYPPMAFVWVKTRKNAKG